MKTTYFFDPVFSTKKCGKSKLFSLTIHIRSDNLFYILFLCRWIHRSQAIRWISFFFLLWCGFLLYIGTRIKDKEIVSSKTDLPPISKICTMACLVEFQTIEMIGNENQSFQLWAANNFDVPFFHIFVMVSDQKRKYYLIICLCLHSKPLFL